MQTTLEVPDALQLRTAYDSRVCSPAKDWESKLQERFLTYFRAPNESSHALNSFLVMQVSRGEAQLMIGEHLGDSTSGPVGLTPDEGVSVGTVGSLDPDATATSRRDGGGIARSAGGYCVCVVGWVE